MTRPPDTLKWIFVAGVLGAGWAAAPVTLAEDNGPEAARHWAYTPPVPAAVPQVRDAAWPRTPIDHFILAALEAEGLSPAPPADKRTLIRRMTYDLIGLPPTPEQIDAFVGDMAPDAVDRLIERLLASPRYGEKWGRHWLDVARYADSNGLDENLAYANAFHYRDYVIDAFNEDKPFDRFLHEQLAGDLLPPVANETERQKHARLIATAFLALGPKMLACDDGQKMEMDIIDEQVETTSRAFMGMTMGCARCHDHKFDPFTMKDYYGLAGIFKSTRTMENFKVVAQWHEHTITTREQQARIAAHEKKIEAKGGEVKARRDAAQAVFLSAERAKAGAYLRAAAEFVGEGGTIVATGKTSIGDLVAVDDLTGRGVLREAEAFERGTLTVDRDNWGKGVGVLLQSGFAEHDLDLPAAGKYQLELRYAAAESRPVRILLNGKVVKKRAAREVTGGWYRQHQRWHLEGVYELPAGRSVLRIERDGVVPHIDKLLLVRVTDAGDAPTDTGRLAAEHKLNEEILKQWVGYLRHAVRAPDGIWKRWAAASAEQRRALTDEYAQAFAQAAATDTPAGAAPQAFRVVLHDAKGPYRLPDKPERFFDAAAKADLERLAKEKAALEKSKPAPSRAMGVRDGKVQDLKVHLRGSYLTLGENAPRRVPAALAGASAAAFDEATSGRLHLARWLTDSAHPLTARVIANRIWLWHFGEGLVRTPDNFGRLGQTPTNQPLLDCLALHLVDAGWSIKAMHRLILRSATYRMSTTHNAAADEKDPENRRWWRFRRRRLTAEEIRDTVIALGGRLDLAMHGQLLPNKNREYVTGTSSKRSTFDFDRRSVYLPVLRSAMYRMLWAFDFPDPSVIHGQRASTTVAPQALFMMNGELVLDATRRLAERLLAHRDLDDEGRVDRAHRLTFGRHATEPETQRSLAFVQRYAAALETDNLDEAERRIRSWQGLCRVLIASNECIYVD